MSKAVAALLLLSGPEETQEETVWPRWLLLADTAKANEQSALSVLDVFAAVVGGYGWKGIPLSSVDPYLAHLLYVEVLYIFVQTVCLHMLLLLVRKIDVWQ